MDSNLINDLKTQYPKLYKRLETIACENGWFDLLSKMSYKIQNYIDENEETQVSIHEIKNLYGMLSITATTHGIEDVEEMIEEIENKSLSVCEFTGQPGTMHSRGSVFHVVCPAKATEHKLTLLKTRLI